MAQIVAAIAASHAPTPFMDPQAGEKGGGREMKAQYLAMGRQLLDAKPETLVIVTNEHLHAFSLANMPAFCIGVADRYRTPYEEWIKVERQTLKGDPELGSYLVDRAYEEGFDPSYSQHLPLDHGTYMPFYFGEIDTSAFRVVPLIVNGVQAPMPTLRRCQQWGRFLAKALAEYSGAERVAVMATGGLSHDIGTPNMGMINQDFDREFLHKLEQGSSDDLVRYCEANLASAGNGAQEIRNWILLKSAMDERPVQVKLYAPEPNWLTGMSIAIWDPR